MQTLKKTWKETIPAKVKPARAPRFNPADIHDAALAAIRSSLHGQCPMFVYPTPAGLRVSWQRPALPPGTGFFRVEAKAHDDITCQSWEA